MSRESETMETVADLIGTEAFRALLKTLGGRRIFVPTSIGENHPLSQAIGLEKAQVLSRSFTGEHLTLPLTARKRDSILRDLKAGHMTTAQIAAKYWLSRRHIFRLKAELSRDTDDDVQPNLF